MTITDVFDLKVIDAQAVFSVGDAEGRTHEITLTDDARAEIMSSLVYATLKLHHDYPPEKIFRGPTYSIKECSVLTKEDQQQGVAFRTTEGFDLSVVLDQRMRARLRACIDEIDNKTPAPRLGPTH